MKKFLVENVNAGVSRGGFACGPVSGHVVAEVRLRDMEKDLVEYHSLVEVEGCLEFFRTANSTYDCHIADDYDDEVWDELMKDRVGGYCDYREFYQDLVEMKACDEERAMIWKFLAYLVRADWEEIEQIKAKSIGRCLGDFEIPVCDAEQDYLDDVEEDSEEDDSDSKESFHEKLNNEFSERCIDVSDLNLGEGDSPEGIYSSYVEFHEGQDNYKLEYSFWVNDNAEISHIDWPACVKLVGNEYVPCPDGEVSAKRIYELLREELDVWM